MTTTSELTQEHRDFAAVHLNEIPGEREKKIEELRSWLIGHDEIHSRTDEFFIVRFLRGSKFDVERAKQKLRLFHEQRSLLPEWFSNRDPHLPEIQELLELGVLLPLRKVDEDGRLVVVIRVAAHDPRKHKQSDVLKAGMMVLDLAAREHVHSSIYGIVALHDMAGVQLAHALQVTPTVVKRLVGAWQSYPNRVRSLDYVNAPAHVNVVLNIFRQFMTKKLKDRIHVHTSDGKSLLKKITPSILPAELGGTDSNYETLKKYWKQQVEENKQWFVEDEKYKLKTAGI
ncbi:retinol-binding protein pinta-like [Phymastichus coffea]|uniref:retinol-binding protein pinta-like n=1 Tax=Phymastichus coffea TaxID=108790 RepID=UPI00273C026E|nr:retinol-binding protein pinta-like [Phymastichus coffea]